MKQQACVILVGLGLAACGGGDDSCVTTHADGANFLTTANSCDRGEEPAPEGFDAAPPGPAVPEPPAEGCVETVAFGCDDNGECGERYVRSCAEGAVLPKGREGGCFKSQSRELSGTVYGFDADVFDASHDSQRQREQFFIGPTARFALSGRGGFAAAGFDAVDPFGLAIERFNELFEGREVELTIEPIEQRCSSFSGPTSGPCLFPDLVGFDINRFVFMPTGDFPGFEGAAGVASCLINGFGKRQCTLTLVGEHILLAANRTGESVQEIANAVALHEIGHMACIDHFNRDATVPSAFDNFTAMNSFLLTDRVNPASVYFDYSEDDIEGAIEAFQAEPPEGVVFEREFQTGN